MPNFASRSMTPAQWLMLVLLSVLLGSSFFLTSIALTEVSPTIMVAARIGGAALFLNLLLPLMGFSLPRNAAVWGAFFGMGLLNNVIPFSLIVWGQTHVASGLAAILNATAPLATVVVAHFLTDDEKITKNRLAGVVIGLVGVAVMVGQVETGWDGFELLAQLAILGAALSFAFAGVFGRRFRRLGVAPMVTATGQVTASAVIILPVMLIGSMPWSIASLSPQVWAALAASAMISTGLAYVIYFRLLASAGATNLMLVNLLIPVSTILLGTTILGEQLDGWHYAGLLLIGCGLTVMDGRILTVIPRTRP